MAAPPVRTCAAVGCQAAVHAPLLMCLPHWKLVPSAMRADIWRSYRLVHNPHASASARCEAVVRHRQHVEAAIQAVAEKQGRRKALADAKTPSLF